MKKAWPWIILGVLAIVVLIVIFSKSKKSSGDNSTHSAGLFTPNTDGTTGGFELIDEISSSPAGTIEMSVCSCEQDPQIQEKLVQYNSNVFPFNSPKTRDALKKQVLTECPCVDI